MNVGDVFFDTQFDFKDGQAGEKLFVVLGCGDGVYVVAKTTSKQHGRGTVFGCQNDRFYNFYLPKQSCCLKRSTWVCLDELYEFSATEVLQKHFSGRINRICELPNDITYQIQTCACQSLDISNAQAEIINRSLKVLGATGN